MILNFGLSFSIETSFLRSSNVNTDARPITINPLGFEEFPVSPTSRWTVLKVIL